MNNYIDDIKLSKPFNQVKSRLSEIDLDAGTFKLAYDGYKSIIETYQHEMIMQENRIIFDYFIIYFNCKSADDIIDMLTNEDKFHKFNLNIDHLNNYLKKQFKDNGIGFQPAYFHMQSKPIERTVEFEESVRNIWNELYCTNI